MTRYILALDQGTTSSRAILFDERAHAVSVASRPLPQIYPRPGWVEHDPHQIWQTQLDAAREALARAGLSTHDVAALGITNQRETTILWDRATGEPIANAIVWQCRRSAPLCEELKRQGHEPFIHERTGLVADAYFSATKIRWLLDHLPEAERRARSGEVVFGTVDSWLMYKLSGHRLHATDPSNASRTMLVNIHTGHWDDDLLRLLDIPAKMLPEIRPSSGIFGETDPAVFGAAIPIAGCAGDQQAALFGQACFHPGQAKNTYGTGCFLLMNTGTQPVLSRSGLLTTIAWGIGGMTHYALEGSVFVAGAALQWLRDGLGLFQRTEEIESLARSVPSSDGVYFVPAFVGLGAPYWDMYARGMIIGLTRGTTRSHLVRAALEAIAYQTRDVLDCMKGEGAPEIHELRVDGGAAVNDFLCQFQADILQTAVARPRVTETTALGAAFLAGLAVGMWKSTDELTSLWEADKVFSPVMSRAEIERLYARWQDAVRRASDWAEKEK
ncbi:MAG TPA: glycerol kinase GlpK [Blastocatellia bacterium]|nr:glycerol kinase GlpK [Blastocatellia bacterium]